MPVFNESGPEKNYFLIVCEIEIFLLLNIKHILRFGKNIQQQAMNSRLHWWKNVLGKEWSGRGEEERFLLLTQDFFLLLVFQ